MKRTIFFLSLLLGTSPLPHAQEIDGVTVGNLKMDRNGEYLVVEMDVELSRLEVEANRAVLLTPRLVNGADSADLPAVGRTPPDVSILVACYEKASIADRQVLWSLLDRYMTPEQRVIITSMQHEEKADVG